MFLQRMENQQQLQNLWQQSLARLRREVEALSPAEREWIAGRLTEIAQLQRQLHAFFEKAGGDELCRLCRGACCERGTHHLTLANLLDFLLAGEAVPDPDFSSTCPFLGPAGCRLEVGRRPFNCVTFICEQVEERLAPAERDTFYRLEKRLRALYLAFDKRYAGSSLRGFLIRAERLGERAFLDRI
ncbi:hypothetical protein DESUT3_35580 [Desulfuromonas versatilis]|uniref:YkgJ family cysteine cluster protein n=1 Tax=Desulfuromonas versatilis TaxID=2802975 RepID=A0ABM8I0Q4_9BACT|nr:hypothetical protein [Desulfuromonas versatilis]BCR06489.1 hypothetical protein DESUT3_35580 [Desulfuromonas versatilis]